MSDPRAEVKRQMADKHNRRRDAGEFETKEDKSDRKTEHKKVYKTEEFKSEKLPNPDDADPKDR